MPGRRIYTTVSQHPTRGGREAVLTAWSRCDCGADVWLEAHGARGETAVLTGKCPECPTGVWTQHTVR
ncbi:hypothetical protein [Actinopolyspora halophila]|uniref:hypothetical protein n=1 Tax=Actinopolyspora halophila TaxID=1850 RepID=UPI00037AA0B2|nr:hypothetical protein [Actinopolyspora halophila]